MNSSNTLLEPGLQPPAERLRATTAAVRLRLRWFGVRKSLSTEQQALAADTFGASGDFLSATKKLIDTRDPTYRAVSHVKTRIVGLWRGMSLPYPDPGIRLIRQDQVPVFQDGLDRLRGELDDAVDKLDEHYSALKAAARERLGSLFEPADYPESLQGLFRVECDYPSIEPPDYLRQLSPEIYQQECGRVAARFDEALQLAEDAFTSELSQLVAHLVERLSGQTDGKPKVFRDTAITNLVEFFRRFRTLNVRSSEQLDDLVARAQQVVHGVEPQALRDHRNLRQTVASELGQLQGTLDELLVDRPRRRILRRAGQPDAA